MHFSRSVYFKLWSVYSAGHVISILTSRSPDDFPFSLSRRPIHNNIHRCTLLWTRYLCTSSLRQWSVLPPLAGDFRFLCASAVVSNTHPIISIAQSSRKPESKLTTTRREAHGCIGGGEKGLTRRPPYVVSIGTKNLRGKNEAQCHYGL